MCASDDVFDDVKGKFVFFVTDNAADEIKVGVLLKQHLPNLVFHVMDSTHSLQLAIRHGMAGGPEVEQLQKVLLTNKRPQPSVSNLLRNYARFRVVFCQRQQDDALSALEN